MRIRVICYQLPGFKPQWLLTSMLDAERYPAAEIIELGNAPGLTSSGVASVRR